MVLPVLGDVADPGKRLVFLDALHDTKITNLNARDGEVGDLEADGDGWAGGLLLALDGGQTEVGPEEELLATRELLDGPDDGVLRGGERRGERRGGTLAGS